MYINEAARDDSLDAIQPEKMEQIQFMHPQVVERDDYRT
jgi:hypothetical protein